MALVKTVVRFGLIGGLAAGGLVLLAGQPHARALLSQARQTVSTSIENVVDDPIMLRNQLRDLEAQYPERIAEVQGELISLNQQVAQLERDRAVAQRVVELAQGDLDHLTTLLGQADVHRTENPFAVIQVRYKTGTLSIDEGYARATELRNTVNAFRMRVAESDKSVDLFRQQAQRFQEHLAELKTEHAQFQAQLTQLESQIELIERNDVLIDMIAAREKKLEKFARGKDIGSVGQVHDRMSEILAKQEAKMNALMTKDTRTDYEAEAKAQLERESAARTLFESLQGDLSLPEANPASNTTIEIGPDGAKERNSRDTVASAGRRIVIE